MHVVVIRLARSVSAETMSGALADAVRPRMKSDDGALQSFKSIIAKGLKYEGPSTEMKLCFLNSGDKMTVRVNGVHKGEMKSKSLCEAFIGVYLDKNAVSPGTHHRPCALSHLVGLKQDVRKTLLGWV